MGTYLVLGKKRPMRLEQSEWGRREKEMGVSEPRPGRTL